MSDFENGTDPTGGFVDYLPRDQAESRGLAKVQGNQVRLAADSTTVYSAAKDKGRASIRLEAKEVFDSGLLIADIAHMPGSACGSWPAFWTFNFKENPYGEIDILEGAMFQDGNAVTLWTGNECRFTNIGSKEERNNCKWDIEDARGCGSTGPLNSYGTPFNDVGGGVYALYLAPQRARVWFFPKAQVPADARTDDPDPDSWAGAGLLADFQTGHGGCDVARNFHTQSVVINIDFCGSGVGQEWWGNSADCVRVAPTCEEYVAGNPAAFSEAYWLINSVKLFQ
ncbi:hypothetical protein PG985_000524 [Apiospora marii]|uniref:GH16 domain-containing protein n=1 Tax=Apiospora marii TaxID=335849 RepID=A0ABR1R300_9PEZI